MVQHTNGIVLVDACGLSRPHEKNSRSPKVVQLNRRCRPGSLYQVSKCLLDLFSASRIDRAWIVKAAAHERRRHCPEDNGSKGSTEALKEEVHVVVDSRAGPVGLAALKAVLDSEQFKSGEWVPVAFESREDIGGVWLPAPPGSADPPLTPLYDRLTTNLPHPVMAYTSFSFPPETPLFPVAEKVLHYLNDYTSNFSLHPHIKFKTSVTSVTFTPGQSRRWLVQTSTNDSYYFDLLMVCNGHYRMPRYPSLPGISNWLEGDQASHAVYYRHPLPIYKDKTLLIVGAGPSGHDLVLDLKSHASKVIFSGSNFTHSVDPNGIHLRPRVTAFGSPSTGTVTFADGTVEGGIDYCILATGYLCSFPFLQPPVLHDGTPPPIPPLPKDLHNSTYGLFPLAQHMWPLQSLYPPESIAFLGLLFRVAPFPLVEVQARAALCAFDTYTKGIESGSGRRGIDEQAEAVDIVTRWEMLKERSGESNVVKTWHWFEPMEQFDYRDILSVFAERDPARVDDRAPGKSWSQELLDSQDAPGRLEDPVVGTPKQINRVRRWEREMYDKKDILRKTWVHIEKSGEAEKWLKDVGRGGTDEWVDLMRRVVKFGEELEKEAEEKARL
ncbi:FAD/NAD(P)-binding domain-containing protein [Macrolepiota fuliginosa MF-IS2]|uniref:FAD/NAD(P)-binding domain-containing protein n=1 Tax=Macrolepiota fuliginosa MF-IS2 TaxID=1400762 RepID=A0A9P5X6Q6_9AGAR|nr:FAD/NAD(P)-binding domain-containing protein [Macrolepiota fuliginosa MF-IS2]